MQYWNAVLPCSCCPSPWVLPGPTVFLLGALSRPFHVSIWCPPQICPSAKLTLCSPYVNTKSLEESAIDLCICPQLSCPIPLVTASPLYLAIANFPWFVSQSLDPFEARHMLILLLEFLPLSTLPALGYMLRCSPNATCKNFQLTPSSQSSHILLPGPCSGDSAHCLLSWLCMGATGIMSGRSTSRDWIWSLAPEFQDKSSRCLEFTSMCYTQGYSSIYLYHWLLLLLLS